MTDRQPDRPTYPYARYAADEDIQSKGGNA
jgi:hypothetical protein